MRERVSPGGSLVFKTSGATLVVTRWVRLPCVPATRKLSAETGEEVGNRSRSEGGSA